MAEVLRVEALWHYPVKSMQGCARTSLVLTSSGVEGDRAYGVLDVGSGTVISAKREGRLLEARVTVDAAGVTLHLPGGSYGPGSELDEALSAWLERRCRLVEAATFGAARYQSPQDFEERIPGYHEWEGPEGSFVDQSPLHLLTTASLAAAAAERPDIDWSVRRFRPNVLISSPGEEFVDETFIGRRLRVGRAEVVVTKGCTRCVLTTRPQPGGIVRQLDVLRHLNLRHASTLGVRALVAVGGLVRVGDAVEVVAN